MYHSSSQQHFDRIILNGLIAGGIGGKEVRQVCYFTAAHLQQSEAVSDQKVGSHCSFLTFITSGILTRFMTSIPSQHKTWVKNSIKHSVMLLFTSETFQQMCCQCPWARSNNLVRKTVRSRTARTGIPSRFPCIG